jgi:hypothetical protein
VQHTDHPVRVVPGEELLPGLGDEAYLSAVLVAHADAANQQLAIGSRTFRGSPTHLYAVQAVSSSPLAHLTSLEDVVGEEVDVVGALVEIVGGEALVDLWASPSHEHCSVPQINDFHLHVT